MRISRIVRGEKGRRSRGERISKIYRKEWREAIERSRNT